MKRDYYELKKIYPFSYYSILPTEKPEAVHIRVVAVSKNLIDAVLACENDFTGKYSKELHIVVPFNYKLEGCIVYGAKWFDKSKFNDRDVHFFHDNSKLSANTYGFRLCVGTPNSFLKMDNVILENIKTAENMLIAYERVLTGASKKFILIAYDHGEKGITQFKNNSLKYLPERRKYE